MYWNDFYLKQFKIKKFHFKIEKFQFKIEKFPSKIEKGPAESPPLGERNAKLTLGLGKIAKTYIYMYIDKIFPKKPVETGVYSMLNG